MWDDRRLQTALAALPPEAFIEGPPQGGDLVWRRAVKRLRSGAQDAPDHEEIAPVIPLPID
jgi:hypothetical protein